MNVGSTIADELAAILLSIETICETLENPVDGNRSSIQLTSLEFSGTVRPKVNVCSDHVHFHLQNRFKYTNISKMLQISLRRCMSEYEIPIKMFQSTITEFELDDKVRETKRYFRQVGYEGYWVNLKDEVLGLPLEFFTTN